MSQWWPSSFMYIYVTKVKKLLCFNKFDMPWNKFTYIICNEARCLIKNEMKLHITQHLIEYLIEIKRYGLAWRA